MRALVFAGAAFGLWKPYMAEVTRNSRITSTDHFQDTRHIEFALRDSRLTYMPGDLLCIFPRQSPAAIAAFLERTGLDANAWVCIKAADPLPGIKPVSIKVTTDYNQHQHCFHPTPVHIPSGFDKKI